jgi:pimeloyl-ACP methyl ester carboxylesterase
VAGLIYVDAGYPYALYDSARGDLLLDSLDMQNKMAHLTSGPISNDQKQLIQGLLLDLPRFENDLREQLDNLEAMPSLFASSTLFRFSSPAAAAIVAGEHKYTHIHDPCLAIFANPPASAQFAQFNDRERTAVVTWRAGLASAQEKAFKAEAPSCRIVRIPDANHFMFASNEAEVLREMDTFVASLQ